jgi:hypothetical protein
VEPQIWHPPTENPKDPIEIQLKKRERELRSILTIFEIAVKSGRMVTSGGIFLGFSIAPGVPAPVGDFFIQE